MRSIGKWLARYGEAIYATRILAPYSTDAVDYTQAKDGRTRYAVVKKPSPQVTLACAVPEGARIDVIGGARDLRYRRDGARTVVDVPPDCANAPLPYALRISQD